MEPLFNVHQHDQDVSVTLRDVVSILFKHKSIILITFVSVTLLVSIGLMSLPSVYKASGKLLIKTEEIGNPTFFSGVTSYKERQKADPVNRKMETEMELLDSRPIAEQVITNLGITYDQVYHKPYVHLLLPVADFFDLLLESVFGIAPDPEKQGFADTTSEFVKSLEIAPVRSKSSETTSNLIQVNLRTHDKELSQDALLQVLKVYQMQSVNLNQIRGERALQIISKEKERAYDIVLSIQKELEDFLISGRDAEELYNARKINRNTITTPRDIASIVKLKQQVIKKDLELSELKQVYNLNHSKVRNLQNAITNLKKRISLETRQYAVNDSKLNNFERQLDVAEAVYLDLMKKQLKINLFLEMNKEQSGSRIIIEPPLIPRTSEWKKSIIIGIFGSFAGLMLGLGFAGIREYADHTLEKPSDVQRYFDFEILGSVAELSDKEMKDCLSVLKRKQKK